VLDARFVLYHHVVRRRVTVASGGEFDSPFCEAVGRQWDARLAERRLFVNEQFLTIVRRPARGKTGWPERLQRRLGRGSDDDRGTIRDLEAATAALLAGLEPYGARVLSCYRTDAGEMSEPLEFLSSIYNGEMRPVVLPQADTDLGQHLPYKRVSFGLDALEVPGAGSRSYAAMLSNKQYPAETPPGLHDNIRRLPCELVLTETFAPAERQIARERIDLALRRQKASEEDSGTERREMLAARDALGAGQAGFGDHHFSLMVRAGVSDNTDVGVYFTKNPGANYGFYAAQVQHALVKNPSRSWNAAARLSFASLYGPDDLDLRVYGVDLLASRTFALTRWATVSPYVGGSTYLSSSHEKTTAVDLDDEHVLGAQAMVGATLQVSKGGLGVEYNAAKVNSFSIKIGVGT
jgi:hypothetical protein